MVVVPTNFAVTNPELSILAMVGLEDVHGVVGDAVPSPVICEVDPMQALKVPDTIGNASTVKVTSFLQPALLV